MECPACKVPGVDWEAVMVALCVFDAYGTLFDVDAAARRAASEPGAGALAAHWPTLSADWRRKQLEYTWLRSLAGAYVDFWQVTQDALDWALDAAGLDDPALRARLLDLYLRLDPFEEVPQVLNALQGQGVRLAILSNGSSGMLSEAVTSAGLDGVFDAVLSVDEVGIYKPAPAVYDMVGARFGIAPKEVLFVSSNGWDICSGAAYGLRTLWVNRASAPQDRLHGAPEHVARDLRALPDLIGGL
ncbi:haloacid dehalogenase type II [Roseinatronobacter sp.]|uniref:haloacid dehalogenase type II n=1 Tax=Roseinatronobacter sp. TaxID=1945755 RepID=UPI0034251AB4